MDLELQLTNERRALSSVRAMTRAALAELPLGESADALERLVCGRVSEAIDHAYPAGESGAIRVSIRERHGKLEICVRDYGLPQDVAAMEEKLHRPLLGTGEAALGEVADEVHWLGFGREGKAFQIIKWFSESHIADRPGQGDLSAFDENAPAAPPQEYDIRRLRPEEAVQVSQLMYRAYGNTYFNDDVYYPERVAAQNANNSVLSFVAVGADGTVAGHYALELNQPGPVAEGGQAVVDPAHRGRGLFDRLKAAALQAAGELDLVGWYADAVAVHTLTQQSNAKHGGHLTAVDLGISPATERFRKLADEQTQRVTCLLYFHWLKTPVPRTVFVPQRHREIVAALYENLGCEATFAEGTAPSGHGTLSVAADPGGRKAFLRAGELGDDTLHAIRRAKRDLVEHSHLEAIYAELPLHDPATSHVAEALEVDGFGFLGIAPHFAAGGDVLRMAYLVDELEREPIKTYEDLAGRLADYALSEQQRVRRAST